MATLRKRDEQSEKQQEETAQLLKEIHQQLTDLNEQLPNKPTISKQLGQNERFTVNVRAFAEPVVIQMRSKIHSIN